MFIQLLKLVYRYQEKWINNFNKRVEEKDNPFVFNNDGLWEKSQIVLEHYIEQEIENIATGKRTVVFTNRDRRLFQRTNVDTEAFIQQLIRCLEANFDEKVCDIDRAFLTCKIYNEVEDEIIRGAIEKVFMKGCYCKPFYYYLFVKKMRMLLVEGKELVFTDLEELYGAYHYKTVWEYYYED